MKDHPNKNRRKSRKRKTKVLKDRFSDVNCVETSEMPNDFLISSDSTVLLNTASSSTSFDGYPVSMESSLYQETLPFSPISRSVCHEISLESSSSLVGEIVQSPVSRFGRNTSDCLSNSCAPEKLLNGKLTPVISNSDATSVSVFDSLLSKNLPEPDFENMVTDEFATPSGKRKCQDNFAGNPLPSGRFICDLAYVIKQARSLEEHSYLCNFQGKLVFKSIIKSGLKASLHFVCSNSFCSKKAVIFTEEEGSKLGNINQLAVLGALATGSGFSQEEEKFSTMNVNYMSHPTFIACEKTASKLLDACLEENLNLAVQEERILAESKKSIDAEGFHCVPVVVDGGWCKRTYGHGYNSASGAAVIIGHYTQKILYIGVKNKVCLICNAIERGRIEAKPHFCWRNWSGASTAMESDVIVEGLQYLETIHCIRCIQLIGDGDSNTMTKIREEVSYGNKVKKIECANHAIRRYRRALTKLQTDASKFNGNSGIQARKLLKQKLTRLVTGARVSIKMHNVHSHQNFSSEAIAKLSAELKNGPSHVFGKHDNCEEFCSRKDSQEDDSVYKLMMETGMLSDIQAIVQRVLIQSADSLIWNTTNNSAENYMSQFCKTSGGKRVDHSKAGGITRRAKIAALAYQEPAQKWLMSAHKCLNKKNPATPVREFVRRRQNFHLNRIRRRKLFCIEKLRRLEKRMSGHISKGGDKNYGDNCQKPDVSDETLTRLKSEFLFSLKVSSSSELENATRKQSECPIWKEERSKRISSSFFKDVIGRKNSTLCGKLVKRIVYPESIVTKALEYGKVKEKEALLDYCKQTGYKVDSCGLFVCAEKPFLCASPDGLIGKEGLVEIKCPYSARLYRNLSEASQSHNIGLKIDETGSLYLPKSHKYFYQIQGQLAITQRQWCDLFFWSESDSLIIKICRDENFWIKGVKKLENFFMDCILPELVDSRFKRNMPIREPQHILDARNEKVINNSKNAASTSTETSNAPVILHLKPATAISVQPEKPELKEKRIRKPKSIFDL
ncbi:uncharacterized protein [Parasteatoda tepidariorum]|uniref:uncharacterized protein isoform X2 n=1 Tax=Parasteatoda tepidariorum TaxID=114398 RepID=UPI001C729071|nr:uncharacterized protein LOC107449451 isoform X2 [Parasteatoda tepidariorum]